MTESEVEVFPPGPAPTSEDFLGCFKDTVSDRVLTTVVTDNAMILEVSESYTTCVLVAKAARILHQLLML